MTKTFLQKTTFFSKKRKHMGEESRSKEIENAVELVQKATVFVIVYM